MSSGEECKVSERSGWKWVWKEVFCEKNRESGKLFRKLLVGGKERRKACPIAKKRVSNGLPGEK